MALAKTPLLSFMDTPRIHATVCKTLYVDTGSGPLRNRKRLMQWDERNMEMSHCEAAGGRLLQAAD